MEKINSLQNRKVKEWASLQQKKYRDIQGRFLIEGKHLIQEALEAGCVEAILYSDDQPFDFDNPGIRPVRCILRCAAFRCFLHGTKHG